MPYFTFDEPAGGATAAAFPGDSSQAFYFKPLLAARENPGADFSDLGYWSRPFYLNGTNGRDARDAMKIITYSVPSSTGTGRFLACWGWKSPGIPEQIPALRRGADRQQGGYLLAVREASGGSRAVCLRPDHQSGSMLGNLLGDSPVFTFEKSEKFENIYHAQAGGKEQAAATVHPLKLYNSHTPFEADQWVLVGVASQQELLRFPFGAEAHRRGAAPRPWCSASSASRLWPSSSRPIAALVRKLRNSRSQPAHPPGSGAHRRN
ncbi:MAG: hypothetical protein ACLU9S_04295 [Oscillospiraceae bacterium]